MKYFFWDDEIVDKKHTTAEKRLHEPVRREAVLTCDRPWEGDGSGYFHYLDRLNDGEKYVLVPDGSKDCDNCALCGSLGVCKQEHKEPTNFINGIRVCIALKGVWKKEADVGR